MLAQLREILTDPQHAPIPLAGGQGGSSWVVIPTRMVYNFNLMQYC